MSTDSGLRSTITQEFREVGGKLQHRLCLLASGETTGWANYTQYTYLRGYVGITAYYADKEAILSPVDFLMLTAVR